MVNSLVVCSYFLQMFDLMTYSKGRCSTVIIPNYYSTFPSRTVENIYSRILYNITLEIKWFFVIVGIFLTFAILTGMYFIGTFISMQSQKYYDDSQKSATTRFDNSTTVHNFLYNAINKTTRMLDPLLEQIPNATKSHEEQITHYNQTTQDFKRIKQVLEIKLQDHITLHQVNNTVNQILGILSNNQTVVTPPNPDNGSIIIDNTTKPLPVPTPLPSPVPAPITNNDTDKKENDSGGIIVENITDVSEGGKDKALVLLSNQ